MIPFRLPNDTKQKVAHGHAAYSQQERKSRFDWFSESGEWRNRLGDLEARGWVFLEEKNGQLFFQTPDGDHTPDRQDGNIRDGVAYVFSKAPHPFENDKGYSICQLFAGVLFGDISDVGLAKFATQYFSEEYAVPEIVLNSKEPLVSADKFIETTYSFQNIPTLRYYADDYWRWVGNAYRKVESGKIKNELLRFLERAKVERRNKNGNIVGYEAFPMKPSNLHAIEEMLKMRVFQTVRDITPFWLGSQAAPVDDPSLLIFGKSHTLNLETMETLQPSPLWFNTAALDFDYDPDATCPQWDTFLGSIFEDDEQSKQTLMEWIGLCLTPITKFQKALFMIGVIRSGKGTIVRIAQKVIGHHNTTAQSTSDFAQTFGFESFLGKTLAIVSDARFDRRNSVTVIEKVLTLTGEDEIKINRKNKQSLSTRLPIKLMVVSNDVPNIPDPSGALPSRGIFLKLSKSFFGQEDINLEAKLSSELPGILTSAIKNLQMLLKREKFIQPESGQRLLQRMTALSSPVGEFIKTIPPSPYATRARIWDKWKQYCEANERRNIGSQDELWSNLESAGYICDFDAANIVAKIRQNGSATAWRLRECAAKFHQAEMLNDKLRTMVKAGYLRVRNEVAGNNQVVEFYSLNSPQLLVDEIPASSPTQENTEKYADGGDRDGIIGKSVATESSQNLDSGGDFATLPGTVYPADGCADCQIKGDGSTCTACPWIGGSASVRRFAITIDGITYRQKSRLSLPSKAE